MVSSTSAAAITARFENCLNEFEQQPGSDRNESYNKLLIELINETNLPNDITASLFKSIASSGLKVSGFNSIAICRSVFSTFNAALALPKWDSSVKVEVGKHVIDMVPTEYASNQFLDNMVMIHGIVGSAYEEQGQWLDAVQVLTRMPSGYQKTMNSVDIAKVWIRMAKCYLKAGEPNQADIYLGKFMHIMHNFDDSDVHLSYMLVSAQVSDAKHRFLDAATKFYRYSVDPIVNSQEGALIFSEAVSCGIVVPAGPERTSLLSTFIHDPRAPTLPEYGFLEKVYRQHYIEATDAQLYATRLPSHRLQVTDDGSTAFQHAILEHNLLSLSKVYANISIDNLAELLGLEADAAERMTCRMIEQQRLLGAVDQIGGFVTFEKEEAVRGDKEGEESGTSHKDKGRATVKESKVLEQWEANIVRVARYTEVIAVGLERDFPEWTARHKVAV